MSVVIYTRVSTDEQARQGYSLPHQKMALEAYCKLKNIDILEHFEEEHSAKDFENRPVFNKMLEYIKINRGVVKSILFTRWDRFSRNAQYSHNMIDRLRTMGIAVNSMEQPLDMNIPENKILLSIYLTIPEVENDKNSIRTTEGMRKAMKQGCFMGLAPIGYLNSRNSNNDATLTPNKEIAPLIKQIFEEYSLGIYSAEELRLKFIKKGLKISKQSFLNLLRNPTYCGKISIKQFQKEDAQIVDGLHQEIISEDLFLKTQDILNGKKATKRITKVSDEEFPLRGTLICECHGKKLTGSYSTSRNGTKHSYYHGNTNCPVRFKTDTENEKFIEYLGQFETKPEINNLYKEFLKDAFGGNELYGVSFLSSLKNFYESSPVAIKKKIIGSIFHENLIFSNEIIEPPK